MSFTQMELKSVTPSVWEGDGERERETHMINEFRINLFPFS